MKSASNFLSKISHKRIFKIARFFSQRLDFTVSAVERLVAIQIKIERRLYCININDDGRLLLRRYLNIQDDNDDDDEKEKKKGGKDSKKKTKKKKDDDEAFEDSDDGDDEGREVDYMSDESSDSEGELEQVNQ